MANSEWGPNLRRLLGLHDLTAAEASRLLQVSPQTISEWTSKTRAEGTRDPQTSKLQRVAEFFELPGSMAWTPFSDLLPLLANSDRFERVEKRIRASRTTLKPVDSGKATGQSKPKARTDKAKGR